ncbi:lipoprotein signal peptidase [Metamycoplasma cloacale]|uniref:Signal peptidase II n=1 Tax=Metamycoplasma cloacale TaxID=92401 RepID=A0A2Z4LMC6_9BACT|nr:signal peptidase II [Metamycoplasma cloacale]AWX42870.1 signal peptidase II [Metamycoplasma cloacale]VEU79308.1 lipoprotein signal peptidase [Metamycoplasma cloacale]
MDKKTNKFFQWFPIFTKKFWKQYTWKDFVINLSIYFIFFAVTLLIDLLTKHYLFKYTVNEQNEIVVQSGVIYQNALFGFRSVKHAGTTIEIGLTNVGLHIVSFIIIIVTLSVSFLFKDKKNRWIIPFLALLSGGAMGNMVDRFLFDFVRDIVFLPWIDTGTFNYADAWLVIGAIGTVISGLTIYIINWRNEKKEKQQKLEQEKQNDEQWSDLSFNSEQSSNIVDPNNDI